MKIDVLKFGIAFGLVYAVVFFLYGLVGALFGVGVKFAEMIGEFYAGFGPTIAGAFAGALWGFGVGFVFFALAAAIYNRLLGDDA